MIRDYAYFLDSIGEAIQISDSQYEKLKSHYDALCKYINDKHVLADDGGNIFQQGSFATNTVIKPLRGEEFDVDMVAQFEVLWQPQHKVNDFYNKLYDIFKTDLYEDKLEKYRNNIRINYKSNYHFDIMPIVKTTNEIVFKAPDTKMSKWVERSPKTYSEWFNEKSRKINKIEFSFNESDYIFHTLDMDKDDLKKPEKYMFKSPLKRAVQLVKRARDKFFYDCDEYIPQSIVITTLIGNIYEGETDIVKFLTKISKYFKELAIKDEIFEVRNPIKEIDENYTEKWFEKVEYYENFKKFSYWFDYKLENLNSENIKIVKKTLSSMFNIDYTNLVESQYITGNYNNYLNNKKTDLFSGEKLIEDYFELDLKDYVELECNVDQDGYRRQFLSKIKYLKKKKNLEFFIKKTSVSGNYKCYWKVRNIGEIAERKSNIRGQIDIKKSSYTKKETSDFAGPHFVECYIVKNNKVVATDRIEVYIE